MSSPGRLANLRPCSASDDAFLYDVFCTTWQSEVAALPNQNLAQHVLRIQHIAQERRFSNRHPEHERYIIVEDGEPAGRLYLAREDEQMVVLDLTLLPRFRSRGIGTRLMHELLGQAREEGRTVALRVGRRDRRVTDFYTAVGMRLVGADDLDNFFEWSPSPVEHARESEQAVHSPVSN